MRRVDFGCAHKTWLLTASPPDITGHWYRCKACRIFGYRKNRRMLPYKCTMRGCTRLAVDRLPGRGPRMNILWRCARCMGEQASKAKETA